MENQENNTENQSSNDLEPILKSFETKIAELEQNFTSKLESVLADVDKKNSNFAGYLKKEFANPVESTKPKTNDEPKEEEEKRYNLKAVKEEINSLRQQLSANQDKLKREKINNHISRCFSAYDLKSQKMAEKVFLSDYGNNIDFIEGDDEPYVIINNTPHLLTSYVDNFLKNDGNVFLNKQEPLTIGTVETKTLLGMSKDQNSLNRRIVEE